MRLQGETRELLCELTAEDLEVKGRELAAAVETEQDLRADLAEWWSGQLQAKKARKEEVTRQEGVCAELAGVLQRRQERRSVSCNWQYALEAGYAFLVRSDTQELVTHRKLRDEERQMEIGEPPFAEPTPEQLEEWLRTLPVNEEQSLPEGHAEEVQAEDRALDLDTYEELLADETEGEICGVTMDHDVPVGHTECRRCGAELIDDAIATDEHGEPLEEFTSAGSTTPPFNPNPGISELAAMPDEQVAKLARRK